MSTSRVSQNEPSRRKMTKKEAARELTKVFEQDMECKGYSEAKKHSKIKQFVEYVDEVIAARAK